MRHLRTMRLVLVLLALLVLAAACAAETAAPTGTANPTPPDVADGSAATPTPARSPTPVPAPTPTPTPERANTDPAEVGTNELGDIPVLMYHRLLPDGGGEYDRTPDGFRAELELLCERGYRPVRMIDVVRGHIDVPPGTTPVVLTFDDSTREQLAFDADGEVDPDTAVGILLDVAAGCDGFEPVASLYVNAGPFGGGRDSDDLLRWLHAHGFELGNHTAGHTHLGDLPAEEVQRELAKGVEVVTDVVPDAEVATLSLPFGIWPTDRELAVRGAHGGTAYEHEGILLVGAGPARSPFHADFDPLAVPRIRSGAWDGGEPNFTSAYWLDLFERHPERRYVSDGDPATIAFPAARVDELHERFADRAHPYE